MRAVQFTVLRMLAAVTAIGLILGMANVRAVGYDLLCGLWTGFWLVFQVIPWMFDWTDLSPAPQLPVGWEAFGAFVGGILGIAATGSTILLILVLLVSLIGYAVTGKW